jgi:hypothetical protein
MAMANFGEDKAKKQAESQNKTRTGHETFGAPFTPICQTDCNVRNQGKMSGETL